MAEKRMFTKKITESDAFLDMPLSAQCLYFHLNMNADDDGFVNAPKKIQRLIGAKDDDLKLLIAKSFILVFETGVLVIKHWRMHNTIRQDRYHPTDYQEEYKKLELKGNNSYTWQPNGNQMEAENRLDKISIDKNSIDKEEINKEESKRFKKPTIQEIIEYCKERNNGIDANLFYDFYESKGWMVGSNKMISWKACVRTWEQKKKKGEHYKMEELPSWFDNEPKKEEINEERKKLAEQLTNGTWKP